MKKPSSARLTRFVICIAALLLLTASTAMARSITVTRWVDTVHVDEDGSARVSEQITYTFSGAYHGIYRDIPIEYPGPKGELHVVCESGSHHGCAGNPA